MAGLVSLPPPVIPFRVCACLYGGPTGCHALGRCVMGYTDEQRSTLAAVKDQPLLDGRGDDPKWPDS